jgi:hypothetical protein
MSHHHHQSADRSKKKLHQDWRVIAAVVLMLIAMLAYVLTQDESVGPTPGATGSPANVPANSSIPK